MLVISIFYKILRINNSFLCKKNFLMLTVFMFGSIIVAVLIL